MSKINECSDIIWGVMTYNGNDVILAESKLDTVIETMLIFLDEEDLLDIIENRVVPRLLPKTNKIFYDYIRLKIESLRNNIN